MAKKGAHDRRGFYRKGELPAHAKLAAVDIEDPYAEAGYVQDDGTVKLTARLGQFRHGDGTLAPGAPGWTPPPRPTITVIRSLKDDPLGRMHARHQIDQAEYFGGRAYQQCYVAAQLSHYGTIDMANPVVDGGRASGDPLTQARQRALRKLRMVDAALARHHGGIGVLLVRDVLGEGLSIDAAARRRASTSNRTTRSWGWLFRLCLDVIAVKFGYASTIRRR